MKTIVIQSYRTHDVPEWLRLCLQSVRAWAAANRWQYEFLDDRFLALAPDWVHRHCAGNRYAVTDICRLQWLRDKLDAGFERAIWADADVLVFRPARLHASTPEGYAFAHELFMRVDSDGACTPIEGINNAMMVFDRRQDVLDRYLARCLEHLRSLPSGMVPRTALGPALLAALDAERPLAQLHGVGLFTPALMQQIAGGGGTLVRQLVRRSPAPLAGANLCHFMRDATRPAMRANFDAWYLAAVRRLLESPEALLAP